MQEAQIRLATLAKTSAIDEDIVVGKDVLELVAGAMYADPLTVYREYVQNAADAVDEARTSRLKMSADQPHVLISLDHAERSVRIRDLGTGVGNAEFVRKLTTVGASGKRGTKQRGFRGVGRLSGLGYCQELVFRSRANGESKIKELWWDGRALREKLRDASFTGSLADVIRAVTRVVTLPDDGSYPAHFFEVEMRKVLRIKNDLLMNEEEIRAYLSQVAPVPFGPDFKFGDEIRDWLKEQGLGEPLNVELNDGQGLIYHRAVSQVSLGKNATLTFSGVDFRRLTNSAGELLACGWILEHGYIGAMPRGSNMGGVRLRMRDVQVGDAHIMAPLFVEQRFSSWSVGELHVVHPKIVPNGRRDEFEHSAAYTELQDELRRLANEITHTIRSRSTDRQRDKRLALSIAYAENWLDIAQRRLHETIRRAAVEQALDHLKAIDKQFTKNAPSKEISAGVEKMRAQAQRLADNLAKKKDPATRTAGTTKSALAAVSAILSSTIHTNKAIPMAERVIAAMEGKLNEKA
jgi:molecular chaperone HtpG